MSKKAKTKLYLLKPAKDWERWYDKAFGFVVRAASEQEARKMASDECGCEGKQVWLNESYTTCVVIENEGPAEILCCDFRGA